MDTIVQSAQQPALQQPIRTSGRKYIWAIIGVIGIIVAVIITGYFVAQNSADKTSSDYTTSLKSYLGNIYTKSNLAKISPVDVQNNFLKLSKPQLSSNTFSFLSSKYTNAQAVKTASNNKLTAFTKQLSNLVVVYKYKKIGSDSLFNQEDSILQSKSTDSVSLTGFLNNIKHVKLLVDNVQEPIELKSNFADISKDLNDTIIVLTAMISARNDNDQITYNTMYAKSVTITEKWIASEKIIDAYYNDLSNKFTTSSNELKIFANNIK